MKTPLPQSTTSFATRNCLLAVVLGSSDLPDLLIQA